ncbi:acetyl esterase/lipase [Actinocorallia herbida]|uniref:Acetyl esterase/lipase n=1 Tax=Actinocorallia herbida TaxID=58109 RepID=A0A3N1D1X6_9ACTN|nr:alpha/beta hydrolase [Actinocorallia herbida]ROO87544.1 acetyl esterase/lipase [Actinocorallia herbida]
MSDQAAPALHVPARDIPVPGSVSQEAAGLLAMGVLQPPTQWPPVEDLEAWRALVAEKAAMVPAEAPGPMVASCFGTAETGVGARTEVIDVDGVRIHTAVPEGAAPDDRRVYLAIHGGAWIGGGGDLCRLGAAMTAGAIGARVWAVDYRMLPDHPFPAPLDDCLTAYRRLLEEYSPEEIIVGGVSAGANLAVALLLRARDEGLPLPAAAVVETVPADLTAVGDTYATNKGVDTSFVDELGPIFQLYSNGHDLRNPYLSPLFADFGKGFPPAILTSGTRDFLLSDTVRLHRRLLAAGVPADLHVFEAAPHAMFLGLAPEDHERAREVRAFAERHWPSASSE